MRTLLLIFVIFFIAGCMPRIEPLEYVRKSEIEKIKAKLEIDDATIKKSFRMYDWMWQGVNLDLVSIEANDYCKQSNLGNKAELLLFDRAGLIKSEWHTFYYKCITE